MAKLSTRQILVLARTAFDSPAKSIYTLSDEGADRFLYAQWL